MKKFITLLLTSLVALPAFADTQEEARLLRFPTVGGDKIVFCYAGDLYSVSLDGGAAVRLTASSGYECFPKISPDGKTIAFTGNYDGNTEVYTIPVEGGEPRRLTFSATVSRDQVGERMGPNNIVMGWTPDGKKVIYRSKQHNFSGLRGRLCLVDAEGGVPEYIPSTEGGFCSFSPDGKYLAMNRMFREFRTWKYYRGGQADDIWVNTVGTDKLEKITDNDAQDIFPMWIGDKIFYLSDRDRTMNLFVYDRSTKQTSKITDFTEYDIKFPSCSSQYIVFENGGYIYKYDVAGGALDKVTVTLGSDGLWGRSEYRNLDGKLSDFSLSPDGKRVLAIGRGDIFSLPAEKGPVYNLSRSPQSHEREPRWSPDGSQIAWISDVSGEYQVYVAPSDDPENAKAVTDFQTGYPSGLQWSPDGSKLYFSGNEREVYEVNVASASCQEILRSERMGLRSFTLSPDGSWAAYLDELPNEISALFLYDVASRKSYQVTDRWYDSGSPIFSQDGKYLFFTSAREARSQYSRMEWNATFSMESYVFLLPLAADTPNPLALGSDEYSPDSDSSEEDPKGPGGPGAGPGGPGSGPKSEASPSKANTKVDLQDIALRISPLPLSAGAYRLVLAKDDKLYYSSFGGFGPGMGGPGGSGMGGGMKVFDLKTLKTSDGPEANYVAYTPDYSKALARDGSKLSVVPFGSGGGKGPGGKGPGADSETGGVPSSEADIIIDHEAEWAQIFDESWRVTRDNFYVENMHGVDWQAMHDKYAVMLPYVRHRDDLSYLIGEMLGELNVGHAYITSGESPEVTRIQTGLLGARYSKDSKGGAFKIEKIFAGANWDSALRSPLTEPGVDAQVGEYILEVNGIPSSELADPGQALIGKAGKTVSLVIASNASGKGARTVYVKPVADESELAYYEWVKRNIAIVDELSGGKIGYIHIPDMGQPGLKMFAKLFYTQLDKQALIIDDRMNGGGNTSPMIIERLQREVYRVTMYRNGVNGTVPDRAFYGPKVCLIDKYSSSDGDLFPYGFRRLGLGKLIGTRSWGGIVGISGSRQYVDGQDMRTPFFTSYSTDGEWIIEGHGVDPDIEVDINPFDDWNGTDAQLEKAVSVLLEELKDYQPLPGTPEAPVKNQ